jgi:Xaa-Pro aminopeptidase
MFDKSVYIQRREKLRKQVQNGIGLILGNVDSPMNYPDNTFYFRQDSNFLYFFGLDFQALAGVMDFDEGRDYLFGDDVDVEDIIWMGPQTPLQENARRVGVEHTAPFHALFDFIGKAIAQGRKIHFPPLYRGESKLLMEQLLGISALRVNDYASLELIRGIVALRSVKEPCEIREIEKACTVGYEMHVKAMQMAHPGVSEQRIAGMLEGIAHTGGGTVAFPIILSQNGETLHNHDHSQILETGRLLVVDAGGESASHYASDFTRTIPVGGRFTPKQKEIYEIVLAANNKAREEIKPGVTYRSVHLTACEVIASGLTRLGLMKGDPREAVRQGAHALFLPHGLGHMMGLDVHDMEGLGQIYVGYDEEIRPAEQFGLASLRMGRKLQPGFVITNEPGIYFIPALIDQWKSENKHAEFIHYGKVDEYRNFGGIRLEDDILVTPEGAEIIGKRIPIDPEEVEKTVSGT